VSIPCQDEYAVTTYSGHVWHIRENGAKAVLYAYEVPAKSANVVSYEIK
jgi:hypothetical protein